MNSKVKAGSSLTGERYYDYYGSGYEAPRTYVAPRRARPAVAGMQRMQAEAAPRRAASRGGSGGRMYAEAARRPAGRPVQGGRPRASAGGRNGSGQNVRRNGDVRRAPSQGRRPGSSAQRKGRSPLPLIIGAAAITLAVLAAFGITRLVSSIHESTVERFEDNVYVNGVRLTGYTLEEGTERMNSLRDGWLGTTYTLTFQDRTWTFSPASVNAELNFDKELEWAWNLGHVGTRADRKEIIRNLQQVPAEFVSQPTYDEQALDDFVSGIAQEVYVEPVDAEVTLTEEKPMITRASRNGWKLDEALLKENLVALIETGNGDLNLPVNEVQPTIVSDNMEMDVVAKCETDVTFRGFNSRSNVRTALQHFNLFTVYPGDTVSFNDVVGPRTEAMGFKEAPEYAGSNEEMGIGGGVCQASTTLYNAVIQAGMSIIERHRHTMTVSYVEPSQDAAVNYGKKDFIFRNDTDHAIYIYTNVSKELASVTIYGAKPEYRYVLESVIKREEKSDKIGYQDDTEGKHVYYTTDTPVLYKEGHGSCESEGWIVSYDWESGQEVDRVQVNHDIYSAGVNVYWRGVHHSKSEGSAESTAEPSQF